MCASSKSQDTKQHSQLLLFDRLSICHCSLASCAVKIGPGMKTKQLKYLGEEYAWGRPGYGSRENLILLCSVKGVIDK